MDSENNLFPPFTVLPGVIERSQRTIIAHGNLDFLVLSKGTMLTIQNMTWGGLQGFQSPIDQDFIVPAHSDYQDTTLAASGVMGQTRTERGLTFVEVSLSGHMVSFLRSQDEVGILYSSTWLTVVNIYRFHSINHLPLTG